MIHTTVVKHYSVDSYSDLAQAEKRRAEIQQRHPDRDYIITCNARSSYRKYKIEQVREYRVSLPEEGVDFPPEPKIKDFSSWEDYYEASRAYGSRRLQAMQAALGFLKGKMNP